MAEPDEDELKKYLKNVIYGQKKEEETKEDEKPPKKEENTFNAVLWFLGYSLMYTASFTSGNYLYRNTEVGSF